MKTRLVPDGLDQALCARQHNRDLIHHSDKGSRYLSVCYSDRLSEAGSGPQTELPMMPAVMPWLNRLSDFLRPSILAIGALGEGLLQWSMPR
ncbi:MAG: hypothetical protein Q4G66_07975 [bacterium]|nr:hypothetical protein [bacterium]